MQKTKFFIAKMDCSSEEQLIRMALEEMQDIQSLEFDLQKRTLEVIHSEDYGGIAAKLEPLKLGAAFVAAETIDAFSSGRNAAAETALLRQVLFINFFFFVLEIAAGLAARSMGLVADSLDMLADSIVYGLSLYAVGRSIRRKKNVARTSGYFQLMLAVMGLAEIVRRFFGFEEMPSFQAMIIVSLFALIGNAVSLYLLQKSKSKEVHMQASMIFTSNDVIVNIGVMIAGILVLVTASKYPDLIVGVMIFGLVGRGAFRILQLSK